MRLDAPTATYTFGTLRLDVWADGEHVLTRSGNTSDDLDSLTFTGPEAAWLAHLAIPAGELELI